MKKLGILLCLALTGISLLFLGLPSKDSYDISVIPDSSDVDEKIEDFSSIRIVCIVFTQLKNHNSRAQSVKSTWGKRCKSLIFVTNSTLHLPDVSIYDINRKDSYASIWGKTKEGFVHAYNTFKDEADWFLKADDDSYFIMENLQRLIAERKAKPSDPTWFGLHYKKFMKHGYMAGGGYLLSRESTRRFVEEALKLKDSSKCKFKEDGGYEDLEMGKCLGSVGVLPGDSRDEFKRQRMFCFNAEIVLNPSLPTKDFWFWSYIKHPQIFGHPGCCSDKSTTFHYVEMRSMYIYNYLIYNAFVHGENNQIRSPPPPETLVQNMNINWTKFN